MADRLPPRLGVLCLLVGVWLGALLLFCLQPLVGKAVLPRFGGGPEVWNFVMLSFSASGTLGFLAAWAMGTRRGWRRWAIALLAAWGLVFLAGLMSPILLTVDWRDLLPPGQAGPPGLLALVPALLPFGAVMFLGSAAQVLFPYWYGRAAMPAWVNPYFVFAFVHLGGLAGLWLYPFAVEPYFPMRTQSWGLLFGFGAVGLL